VDVVLSGDEAFAPLNAALAEEDAEVFLLALSDVARDSGLAVLAEAAHLNRAHLHRILSENENAELRSLKAVLDALGFRLSIELQAAGDTPAR
jgi:probable addiction module antidote protein